MFERSLVISQESHVSAAQRWTALASITVQVGLAAVLIALPLLHPESMPFRSDAPKPILPNMKVPKVKLVTVERSAANVSSASIAVPMQSNPFTAPSQIPHGIVKDGGPPVQSFKGWAIQRECRMCWRRLGLEPRASWLLQHDRRTGRCESPRE